MPMRPGGPPEFKILVANLTGAYDSKGRPIKKRTGFVIQTLVDGQGNPFQGGLVDEGVSPATATVTVSNSDFTTGIGRLYLGEFLLESGIHWVTNALAATSATNLAAAINRLPGFSASSVGPAVNITIGAGFLGETIRFEAEYDGTIQNFTLSPTTGYMNSGGPHLGGYRILP